MTSKLTKIESAIIFFLKNLPSNPTRTKLMKLLYLADLLHCQKHKKLLTGATYRSYFYGPYSEEIISSLNELKESYVNEIPGQTVDGQDFYLYQVRSIEALQEPSLNEEEKKTLRQTIKKYGDLPLDQILKIVYTSEPYRATRKGNQIRMV